MTSKYRVHINFKNKRNYDYINKKSKSLNISPGKVVEQIIDDEINRLDSQREGGSIDIQLLYRQITRVMLNNKYILKPLDHWSWHINKDYTIEEFDTNFISGKKINRLKIIKLLVDEINKPENHPALLINSRSDITLFFVEEAMIKILDAKEKNKDIGDKDTPKIRISLSYEGCVTPVYLGDLPLRINILKIRHVAFNDLFKYAAVYDFNELLFIKKTLSGGYFLSLLKSPIDNEEVRNEINKKYKNKIKVYLNISNVRIKKQSKLINELLNWCI